MAWIQAATIQATGIALPSELLGNKGEAETISVAAYERITMRSDLIFGALTHVTNRYELCQLASKATRKLHKPNTRLQDTTNEVLDRFKDTVPMDAAAPAVQSVALEERRAA
jgi:hypothetical protein